MTANTSWTATVSGAILMLSTTAGDGDATVTVTAPPAYKPEETEGIIPFSCGVFRQRILKPYLDSARRLQPAGRVSAWTIDYNGRAPFADFKIEGRSVTLSLAPGQMVIFSNSI